tara:strand:- start:737 stop:916 length:180 start_codon:yes stop_codon:yes gene_type:complete
MVAAGKRGILGLPAICPVVYPALLICKDILLLRTAAPSTLAAQRLATQRRTAPDRCLRN